MIATRATSRTLLLQTISFNYIISVRALVLNFRFCAGNRFFTKVFQNMLKELHFMSEIITIILAKTMSPELIFFLKILNLRYFVCTF